ncbi:PLP-dependent aminotransferase family protein [Levilactobacillus tangyuanensis]|uniref:PLP-dependent aminotransferase family protein n=1 Tax=Levilactobacillus tangyuanensis TaxID=2486021 RepID=A0ABW1TJQ8_9LACO|nr:PLP-dependent aminotransferase family protein [Levilactobacillus tangyuanensis]
MIDWYADLPDIKPKYLAITQLIRHLIQEDKLLPGQRLPAERELAEALKVDRSTVSRALLELASVGLVVKRTGSGTFVSSLPQLDSAANKVNWTTFLETTASNNYQAYQGQLLQARALDNGQLIDGAVNELPMDLIPKLGSLQMDWQNFLLAQHQEQDAGYLPLIQTISNVHKARNQFKLTRQSLIIAGGAQQSLLLILRSLLQVGDAVAYAQPSYFNASAIFQAVGVRTYTVPLKHGKLDLAVLEDLILKHRIKLLLLNPTFQNPTGEIVSLRQRQKILTLCQQYQVPIIEDDVFGWLVNKADEVPTFKSLAPANVIYISSLSKLLGSSTRIGWIVAPQAIGQRLLQVQKKLDIVPSMLAQVMANLALTNPSFNSEIHKLTLELTARREAVAKIFHEVRPDWQFASPNGGLFFWITQRDQEIFNHLLANHILVKPGPIYGADRQTFRFNFAAMDATKQRQLETQLRQLKP